MPLIPFTRAARSSALPIVRFDSLLSSETMYEATGFFRRSSSWSAAVTRVVSAAVGAGAGAGAALGTSPEAFSQLFKGTAAVGVNQLGVDAPCAGGFLLEPFSGGRAMSCRRESSFS